MFCHIRDCAGKMQNYNHATNVSNYLRNSYRRTGATQEDRETILCNMRQAQVCLLLWRFERLWVSWRTKNSKTKCQLYFKKKPLQNRYRKVISYTKWQSFTVMEVFHWKNINKMYVTVQKYLVFVRSPKNEISKKFLCKCTQYLSSGML